MDPSAPRCPACDNDRVRTRFFGARVGGYRVLQCRRCGLAFCWPRPTQDELFAFYASGYFAGEGKGYTSYSEFPEENARRQWYELRSRYFSYLTEPGSLLDVGCATGGFLSEAARNGWSVYGTDISKEAADAAREAHGFPVDSGTLTPRDPDLRFDLITMWHVLEHVIAPREALVEVSRFLAPDGLLYVEVPNWRSAGRFARGKRWRQLKPPEHISFFNPRALTSLLADVGLEVVHQSTTYPSLVDEAQAEGTVLARGKAWIGQGLAYAGAGGYLSALVRRAG